MARKTCFLLPIVKAPPVLGIAKDTFFSSMFNINQFLLAEFTRYSG
jgi:hypothetical protein